MTYVTSDEKTYCAVHPTAETALRCNRCGRYMCTRCVVQTPVGYRCRECVNQQVAGFYKASLRDTLLGGAAAFGVALCCAFFLVRSQFIFLTLLLGLPAGSLIGEAAFRMMGRRKARYMDRIVIGCVAAATLLVALPQLADFLMLYSEAARVGGRLAAQVQEQVVSSALQGVLLPGVLFGVMASITASNRLR